ncbi:MAG: DEAD/DEAH box helicase family protein [Ruminococcus sp.]|nr:DEAD/DEAH box helicase family protein [Ruminococcus sp.]
MNVKVLKCDKYRNLYESMFTPYLSTLKDEYGEYPLEACRKFIPEKVGNSRQYIADVVGDDYENWHTGYSYFIASPPATGKTYFCFKVLLEHFKKKGYSFIYICNRTNLKKQVLNYVKDYWNMEVSDILPLIESGVIPENENGIYLTTYQKLCCTYRDNKKFRENLFDDKKVVIVADEIHFLTQDASFNHDVNYFLDGLLNQFGKNSIRLYMTGTTSDIFPLIRDKAYELGTKCLNNVSIFIGDEFACVQAPIGDGYTVYPTLKKIYTLESDYSNIQFHFYKSSKDIDEVLNSASSDNKVMYFVKSKEHGESLNSKFKNSVFLFSDSTGENLSEEAKKELRKISLEEKFSSDILITTSLLDNGINIKDSNVKTLIIDQSDPVEITQMIGRKRIDRQANNLQKIDVYIRLLSLKDISFTINCINETIKELGKIDRTGIDYLKHLTNDSDINLWYVNDSKISSNTLYGEKLKNLLEYYNYLKEQYEKNKDENIFAETVFKIFGLSDFDELKHIYGSNRNTLLKKELVEFLESYAGSQLTQTLRDTFAVEVKKICNKYDYFPADKRDSRMNDNSISKLFKELGLEYSFEANEKTWSVIKENDGVSSN